MSVGINRLETVHQLLLIVLIIILLLLVINATRILYEWVLSPLKMDPPGRRNLNTLQPKDMIVPQPIIKNFPCEPVVVGGGAK